MLKNYFPINILGSTINPTNKVRNLGDMFDSDFSFSSHISAISKSCYFHIHARIRQFLPRSAAITLANALVGSQIDYCNSLLNSVSANDLQRLQRIQNLLTRIVCKKSRYCHTTTPLLKELHWLPVKYRITFKQCLMVYKTIATGIPAYFSELIIPYVCHVNT